LPFAVTIAFLYETLMMAFWTYRQSYKAAVAEMEREGLIAPIAKANMEKPTISA
jgi:hypothetical protein